MSAASRLAIAVPASAAEPDLAGTLASLHVSAVAAGVDHEIVVAVNGPGAVAADRGGDTAPAVKGIQAFAAAAGLPLVWEAHAADAMSGMDAGRDPDVSRVPIESTSRGGGTTTVVRVVRLAAQSKVAAWNALRAAVRAPVIVFADADVRLAREAVGLLLARLEAEPALAVAAGRECARLGPDDGVVARTAALPYRFDFANIPGRLYALRAAALPEPMPGHVMAEDAYLTVRIGRGRFVKERDARVYLRPPTTWEEYLRQRVRHEVGKLQLARDFPALLRAHGFGRYPWRAFLREIAPREYPLVVLALAVRIYARWRARRQIADGIRTGWTTLASTKRWPAERVRNHAA